MITKVLMPKLSEAMETGKVIQWLKKEGDPIKGGDVIAEIETDKANVEVEAFGSGVLRKILVGPGGTVPVGEMIGVIADPADDVSGLAAAPSKPAAPAAPAPATPRPVPRPRRPQGRRPRPPRRSSPGHPRDGNVPVDTGHDRGRADDAGAGCQRCPARGGAREGVPAGPEDRRAVGSRFAPRAGQRSGWPHRAARRRGGVGAGTGGRARAAPRSAVAAAGRPAFAIPPRTDAEFEDVALTPMRAIIAKRMPLSKAPVPHFYVTTEVAMDRAMDLRAELNGLEGQPKISVTDLVIKAVALALHQESGRERVARPEPQAPTAPGAPPTQVIRKYHRAHLGIAVALDEGLITPVLRDCDAKPLSRIAVEARDLAERARAGKLRVPEMSGATFSISNLGMYDVDEFSRHHQSPRGRHPRRGLGRREARRGQGRDPRRAADEDDDLLRPPGDGRRHGRALPPGREAAPRGAVAPPRMTAPIVGRLSGPEGRRR